MNIINKLKFGAGKRLPLFLQTEVAECGLACLAMVSGYHGHQVDVTRLRQRYPLTLRGANLKQIISIAAQLNLSTRALRTDLEGLRDIKTPAILHWDFNHFVVLKSVKGEKVVVHDPAQGERIMSLSEVGNHFTGVVLELQPTAEFETIEDRTELKITHLWSHIEGLLPSLGQVMVFAIALQVMALVAPYFVQLVLDEVLLSHDWSLLHVLGLAFVALHFMKSVAMGIRSWIILYVGTLLNVQLVNNLFHHLIRLPLEYFERRHIGDIVSRFMSVDEVRKMISDGFVEAVVDGVMVTTSIIVMYIYSPILASIALAAVVIYAISRFILYRPHKRAMEEAIVMQAKEESVFLETVRAMQTIKAFGKEEMRQSVWQNRYADRANAGIAVGKLEIGYRTFHELVTGLEYVVLIWVGATAIIDAKLTAGMLIAFLSYRLYFSNQAQSLVDKVFEYKLLRMHLNRIADITSTARETGLYTERGQTDEIQGKLELKNISFRYSEADEYIIKDLSLTIEAGESVVFVGPSGCGKTTLLKIMMGLIKPTSGEVCVDGVDIWRLGLSNYRQNIGSVMQDDCLLSGSISDNISFFDPQVDQQRVQMCAVAAALAEDILKMPMGFQSMVGDLGNTLSGGQQQRLLLARALYKDPRILFLDESTSHLDVGTESKINQLVKQIGITRIMIAHRQETIAMADRIIDLRDPDMDKRNAA